MAHKVEFWGKKYDKKRGTYVTGSIRFTAKGARPTVKGAAQRAAVGTCKAVRGAPKIKLCKVKKSGGRQWRFKRAGR